MLSLRKLLTRNNNFDTNCNSFLNTHFFCECISIQKTLKKSYEKINNFSDQIPDILYLIRFRIRPCPKKWSQIWQFYFTPPIYSFYFYSMCIYTCLRIKFNYLKLNLMIQLLLVMILTNKSNHYRRFIHIYKELNFVNNSIQIILG